MMVNIFFIDTLAITLLLNVGVTFVQVLINMWGIKGAFGLVAKDANTVQHKMGHAQPCYL